MSSTFLKQVLVLALPVALQTLLQSTLGLVDVAMISALNAESIAAVGLAAKFHYMVFLIVLGVAISGGILVAQHQGAGNVEGRLESMLTSMWFGCFICLPLMLIFALSSVWMPWLSQDDRVISLACDYLLITTPVILLTQISCIFDASLRSINNTLLPLVANGLSVLFNIFLNWVLIFGNLGAPELGVAGAAWATLLSRALQVVLLLVYLHMITHPFALSFAQLKLGFCWSRITRFASYAKALMLNHFIYGLGTTIYHVSVGFVGTEALAVMGVITPIDGVFSSVFIGLAAACSIMVSQALGANRGDEAWLMQRRFDNLNVALVSIACLALWLSRSQVVSLFSISDPSLRQLLLDTLTLFCVCIWVKMVSMIRIVGILRSGGDTQFCLYTDTISQWVLAIPILLLVVYLDFAFLVVYALTFLDEFIKFVPIKLRVNKRYWIRNLVSA